MRAKHTNIKSEHEEAIAFVAYLDTQKRLGNIKVFTHTAQETYTQNWGVKVRNKQAGVRPGIADYVIVTQKSVVFIELKKVSGGVVSPAQKEWQEALLSVKVPAFVCKGADHAIRVVEQYL